MFVVFNYSSKIILPFQIWLVLGPIIVIFYRVKNCFISSRMSKLDFGHTTYSHNFPKNQNMPN